MKVKGGIAYIDFRGNILKTTGTTTIEGIHKECSRAIDSNKLIVITNISRAGGTYSTTPLTIPVSYGLKFASTNNIYLTFLQMGSSDMASIKPIRLLVSPNDVVTFTVAS